MALSFENTPEALEDLPLSTEKETTLEWLFPEALSREIEEISAAGYDITIGNTYDPAYDAPEGIRGVFNRLDEAGKAFARESRQLVLGGASIVTAIEYDHHVAGVAKSIKLGGLRKKVKNSRERLRAKHLYDKPDVLAQPWHQQNGKAIALNTIADAHDLLTTDGGGGLYETMSGRLDTDFSEEFIFPTSESFGELAGVRLGDIASDREIQKLRLFMESPVRPGFKDIVAYCSDSLGIRSRKIEVDGEINRYVEASEKEAFLMTSVGCGTALSMLEVVQNIKAKGKTAKLILIDQDPIALATATQLAIQMGLQDDIEVHLRQLFVGKGLKTRLMNLQDVLKGRKIDVGEDTGLREYFTDEMYEDLTRQVWGALADDGLMTTGNMNKNRPQAEFLHGLMGWPYKVRMRHIRDITKLHEKAGIPADASRLRVTQDGVYTLCFSLKQH